MNRISDKSNMELLNSIRVAGTTDSEESLAYLESVVHLVPECTDCEDKEECKCGWDSYAVSMCGSSPRDPEMRNVLIDTINETPWDELLQSFSPDTSFSVYWGEPNEPTTICRDCLNQLEEEEEEKE